MLRKSMKGPRMMRRLKMEDMDVGGAAKDKDPIHKAAEDDADDADDVPQRVTCMTSVTSAR